MEAVTAENDDYGDQGAAATTLSLLPPGEKVAEDEVERKEEEEEQRGEGNKEAGEEAQAWLMKVMQRMIADEVRRHIQSLQLKSAPHFGP